ncbi:PEP-CTERM sorting domain-containing protein [Anabaena sp. CCY 9402-a]|uniref:PEP-CTERM sorting domain-containing protein n=1 Tax=Anabaena sp. CCY 9402-a TaxID=3103867 RepID=UPI0039C6ABD2
MKHTSVFSALLVAASFSAANPSLAQNAGGDNSTTPVIPVICSSGFIVSSYSSCSGALSGNNVGSEIDRDGVVISPDLLARLNSGDKSLLAPQYTKDSTIALQPGNNGFFDFTQYQWSLTYSDNNNGPKPITVTNPGLNSGTWSIADQLTSAFAVAVKGGNSYSVYFFDNFASAVSSGEWDTLGLNKIDGNTPGHSHIDIYTTPAQPIPEPITMFGIGVGLVGGGVLKQKYGKKANKEKVTA